MKNHRIHRPDTLDKEYSQHVERQGTVNKSPDLYIDTTPSTRNPAEDRQEVQDLRKNYQEVTPEREQNKI